ncbi:hypothetical protein M445_18275 [Vibrio owensii 47666-1]|uniref:hypothetical protein n=1 Tax=Vibrio owensii TaxID=696485 RepID=UPI000585C0EB|nr:hypothetical protein [Vibrio owensii]KIF46283.1 hypothetical protein M445_18275 [Vibrio owensii 47666-1]
MERSVITSQLLGIITLQNDNSKDCDQHPHHAPNDKQPDGVLVVVSDGESPLQGEGEQFN